MPGTDDHSEAKIPDYLRHWPGLYVRHGNRIVDAPEADALVARGYPQWPDKGPLVGGMRVTIMAKKLKYARDEEIRIVHVVEVLEPGHEIFVMGPKPVYGQYVDGKLMTAPPPPGLDALQPPFYDGATEASPGVDYNYEITSYKFSQPGMHSIQWVMEELKSNMLKIEVTTDGQIK